MGSNELVAGFDVVAECPKRMRNGPCGGVSNGMCEVSGTCVWVRVYARLKAEGRIVDFAMVRMPK